MSIADLHLCTNSPASNRSNSPCECSPEYYCAEICGEEYSLSTYISWQHFPRSTSSRSRCDGSSYAAVANSISDTPVSEKTSEEEESVVQSATEYPITKSFAQLNAEHYLEIRHVFQLLNFLIGHLVCNEPEDPVKFLEDLLDRCLKFRDSYGDPPVLFTAAHVKSLYNAFDPFERGYITQEQYREALNTLGLRNGIAKFNEEPPLNDEGHVESSVFMFEAERCLLENLKGMLRIPKLSDENRLRWQNKKAKAEKEAEEKRRQAAMSILEKDLAKNEFAESVGRFCDCHGGKLNTNLICKCGRTGSLQSEPEQLFYDNKFNKN